MHLRLSTAIGLPVVDSSEEILGILSGVLINPDTGAIEGIFVRISSFLSSETLFAATTDIQHWGRRIRVRDADSLSPLEDMIRLQQILEERRPILGQIIKTEEGVVLGRCADIQFDTRFFRLEWMFPRRFFFWKTPVPAASIQQVRPDAIIVRLINPAKEEEVRVETPVLPALDPLGTTPAS
jgi:sporulation protein YlmC with PRC-barrel domain